MKSALIGYTGFVGSNLLNQYQFTDTYNSSNIGELAGKEYDLVVCSGARAEKWKINQDPESDWNNLQSLMNNLSSATIKKCVLISTVDVYPHPQDVNEDTPINLEESSAYGKHRYQLEKFCTDSFPTLVVRLPGLFGSGLKKNIIFDFLNNNNLDRVHTDSVFQFYYLGHLWQDIQIAEKNNLSLLNIATEPIRIGEIAEKIFGREFENKPEGQSPARYDFHTKHAQLFGKSGNYLYDKKTVLKDLIDFVRNEQAI